MRKELYDYLFELRSSGFMHTTRDELTKLFEIMENDTAHIGNLVFETEQTSSGREGIRGSLSSHKMKDIRNFIIGCCFFGSDFIVENGGDAEYAYGVSDYFINQLDSARTFRDYQRIYQDMIQTFMELNDRLNEEKAQKENENPLVGKTIGYIRQHLYGTISASDAAAFAGRDTSYLSSLFRKETGLSLQRFILNEKVKESKVMLRQTDRSIRDIAEALGFSSAAHFTKVFKQYEGRTPREWSGR